MNEKTLKFDDIRLNKNEFHKSMQPIDLSLVNVDKIVAFHKCKHSDDGLNILLVTKKVKLINRYVLSYLK